MFAFAGILSMLVLMIRREKAGSLLFCLLAVSTALTYALYAGGIRYAYPAFLIHFLAISICCAVLILHVPALKGIGN